MPKKHTPIKRKAVELEKSTVTCLPVNIGKTSYEHSQQDIHTSEEVLRLAQKYLDEIIAMESQMANTERKFRDLMDQVVARSPKNFSPQADVVYALLKYKVSFVHRYSKRDHSCSTSTEKGNQQC